MAPNPADARVHLLIGLQAFISGASLVIEIVGGRMLAPYVGMSVYTWTSVIAVVLAGLSAGHWWGGRIADRPARLALALTGWLMLAAALATAVAIQLLRLLAEPVIAATQDPVWTIVILTFSVFFLPSLFAGVPAPVLAFVAVKTARRKSGRTLGAMYASGAVGAIGGTLFAGFVFIPWLGTATTLVIVTAVYLGAAIILLWLSRTISRRYVSISIIALMASGLGVYSASRLSPCTEESQYYCIRVVDVSDEFGSPARLMVLDHLVHGISARDFPRVMFTEFATMLDEIARRRMGEKPFSAFFIGGGTYSVPRAWSERDSGTIAVAEIDPAVTEAAVSSFWLDPTEIAVFHEDARYALLKRSESKFDVIIGDAFGDISVPEHLITREFFQLVRSRLKPNGLFLMNVVDFADRLRALSAIHHTLGRVFPVVEIWTEAIPPKSGHQRVFVLAASNSASDFNDFIVREPQTRRFAVLSDTFSDQVLKNRNPFVLTDDFAPIDRLLAP